MKFLPHLLRATLLLTTLGAAVSASAAIPVPEGARVAVAYKTPGQSDIQGVHTEAFMIPASTQKVLTATAASLY